MKLIPTDLPGVQRVQRSAARDERGAFARLWCGDAFRAAGVDFQPLQASLSSNTRRATLRGLHWQIAPHAETKLVSVLRGAIWDVAVDLRPDSPTRLRWVGMRLDAESGDALLIPPGCAHGFVTLTDDSEVLYLIDTAHAPQAARGARWDDPAFGIRWPVAPITVAARDRDWPAFDGRLR
jgi:dTDP-4-dehydrorhamnose 3,5-epimerase